MTYLTKSNQPFLIREATPSNASALLQLKLAYLKNTTTIPIYAHEYANSVADEKALIRKYESAENSILLLAIANNNIIGNIDITGNPRKKMQHTAMIGMGVDPLWQHQGVGTLLMECAVAWAKENNLIKTLWLEVYATNSSAIALYKKLGFITCGHIPGFFLEKGASIDKITMYTEVYS